MGGFTSGLRLCAAVIALSVAGAAAAPNTALAQFSFPLQPPPPPLKKAYKTSWEHYQDLLAEAKGGTKMTFDKLPDWSGVWTHTSGFAVDPSMPRDKIADMLTPEYKARYLKKLADVAKGNEWDPLSYCLPAGYPRWHLEPFLREQILRPEQTWMLTEQNAEIRRVYTDGRGHVPEDEAYPLWEGDSIGFWRGDTLVVHTNHLKENMYQRMEPDHSDQVSTVEEIRRISPTQIEIIMTIYDPLALVKPWHVRHVWTKVTDPPGLRINHWSCAENNNVVKTDTGGSDFILPGEKGYKDPKALGPQGPAQ